MNKYLKKEIFISLTMILIAAACIFYQMELMMYVSIHGLAIIVFVLLGILIWQNKSADERDIIHKSRASDIAFISGGISLSLAILFQIYTSHHVDVWLMITLVIMIASRTFSRYWLDKYR